MEQPQLDLQFLQDFIQTAASNCYLGGFKRSETTERPGFFEMDYADGEWSYRDSFVGYYQSNGVEVVRRSGTPVWAQSYRGGVIDKYIGDAEFFKEIEKFLRTALASASSKDYTPRGPEEYAEGDWVYKCSWKGDITSFTGVEHIFYKGEDVFFHEFHGGLIIGK